MFVDVYKIGKAFFFLNFCVFMCEQELNAVLALFRSISVVCFTINNNTDFIFDMSSMYVYIVCCLSCKKKKEDDEKKNKKTGR